MVEAKYFKNVSNVFFSSFRKYPPVLLWGPSWAALWIFAPTVILYMGHREILAPTSAAPPSPPSFLTLLFTMVFPTLSYWYIVILPFLKYIFPGAPLVLPVGLSHSHGESVGAVWKWLCPAWDSPVSSQRPPLQPAPAHLHPAHTH